MSARVARFWEAAACGLALHFSVAAGASSAAAQEQFWQTPDKAKPSAPAAPNKSPPGRITKSTGPDAATKASPAVKAPASEEELTFWSSVKESKNAEEYRLYLKRYPQGAFVELAQIRLRELGSLAAVPSPTSGAPPPRTPSVRDLQQRLYDLNYTITRFDGILNYETQEAVRAWQKRGGFASTGQMSDEQLAILRRLKPVTPWAAIAYDGIGGGASVAHSLPTRAQAEAKAQADCRAKSGRACEVHAVPGPQCGALAYFRAKVTGGNLTVTTSMQRDFTVDTAGRNAITYCNRGASAAGRCKVLASVCGTGAGRVFPPATDGDHPAASPPGAPVTPQPAKPKTSGQDA